MAGKTVLCAFVTADQREKKTSVKSENADGIPKFLRHEKICGRLVLCAFVTADQREKKTSVKSENADGIPKFLRHEKICGRLPSSPPTESASVTWRFSSPQYLCT